MKKEDISKKELKLLKEKNISDFDAAIEKLQNNYPIQYLIGNVEFCDSIIKVNEKCLIPRFETELLVDKTIKRIKQMNIEPCKILDIGTGSGCIAINLKKNLDAELTAIDISKDAIELAKENAALNEVQIEFKNNSMEVFNYENYDVIISNPPYVSYNEAVDESIKYEPENAIFAGDNGLKFYKIIITNISKVKNKPKLIAFEIGITQGESIINFAKEKLNIKSAVIEKDLTNRDRFVFIELKSE